MSYFLPYDKFDDFLNELKRQGFQTVGPQVKNGAIVYAPIKQSQQLPWGYREEQKPGHYHLQQTNQQEAFAWNNGPQGLKPWLFKASEPTWQVKRDEQGQLIFKEIIPDVEPIAFIGARACDLAALAIQDKKFMQGDVVDERYAARRSALFIVAVNCGYSGENCFCVSTGDGPEVTQSNDITLTEIHGGFLLNVGSERAAEIINPLQLQQALVVQSDAASLAIQRATAMQSKKMPHNNSRLLRDILMDNLDHPRWDDVAERCLSCGNCTQVCPTCFCHHEVEQPSLDKTQSVHSQQWDSCFNKGHSSMHHKTVRPDTKSRYKQWMTHKLGTWWDQFDTSGCIGCGRCITWCPVGIDITEEMAAIAGESDEE